MVSILRFDFRLLLTIVSVGRFNESDRCKIFFVGHNKLIALPAGCWVIEYTSSAYSGRFPSATSHMPSRNFIVSTLEGESRRATEKRSYEREYKSYSEQIDILRKLEHEICWKSKPYLHSG